MNMSSYSDVFSINHDREYDEDIQPGDLVRTGPNLFPHFEVVAVHGDKGSVVIEQDDLLLWKFASETPHDDVLRQRFAVKTGASGGSSNPAAISHQGHARQLRDAVTHLARERHG